VIADETMQTLVANRLVELDLSLRQAAARTEGMITFVTIGNIARGYTPDRYSAKTLRGLALALDLPLSRIQAVAEQGAGGGGTPFILPDKARWLTARDRRAVIAVMNALLAKS
jgi:transcriptional regulator with XRE-family HTH domain